MAEEPRWEGKLSFELNGPEPYQIWPLWEDFGNIHNWLPTLETCYIVEGLPGRAGLTRYCANTTKGVTKWAKERLLAMDPKEMYLSYEIIENNLGLKNFVAIVKLEPCIKGCRIVWSFVCDPVDGCKYQDFMSYYDFSLKSIAENMGTAIQI